MKIKFTSIIRSLVVSIATVCFLTLQICMVCNLVLYHQKFIQQTTVQSGYGMERINEFEKEWKKLLDNRGIGSDFGMEYVDTTILYTTYLNGWNWSDQKKEEEAAKFQNSIENEVKLYLSYQGVEDEAVCGKIAEEFAQETSILYKNYVFPEMVETYGQLVEKRKPMLWYVSGMCLGCIIVSLLYVFVTDKTKFRRIDFVRQMVLYALPALCVVLCMICYEIYVFCGNLENEYIIKIWKLIQMRMILTGIIFVMFDGVCALGLHRMFRRELKKNQE